MQNMPAHIESLCREYARSWPGLRESGVERALREVRTSIGDVLRIKNSNKDLALLRLSQWTKAQEDELIEQALRRVGDVDEFNGPLNAVANLNSLVATEITGADGVKNFVPQVEKMGVNLTMKEEAMVVALKLGPEATEKVREKMRTIKSGDWDNYKVRGAGELGLRSVAAGKVRIVFNAKTGEIVSVGQIKEVYNNKRARN